MQRPTPLPAPPVRRAGAAADAASSADAASAGGAAPGGSAARVDGRAADADASGAADGGAREPEATLPFARPGSLADSSASTDADGDPVRVRDVWKAAHARRKALRAEVRRFTARTRRRRAIWIGAGAAVLALVVGSLGAAYSPLFAVEQVSIVGANQLDVAAVQQALAPQIGTPMPLVDASEIKAALVAFPLIESYSLEARPPHDLVIRIVERTPVGVVSSAAGFSVVDAAGVALSTTTEQPAGQPLITAQGGPRSDAFAATGLVLRSLPEAIRVQVTAASASSPDDVSLTLGATNTEVIWGSAADSVKKVVVLEKLMVARPPADVSGYDVSSPTATVVW